MRLGFFLPQIGAAATPEAIKNVAERAEALTYDSVWVTERLLYPLQPQTPYVASKDGSLPDAYRRVFDPLETLSFAAAHTRRIGLGTSVLDMPFYNPVVLARQLTALDIFSGGRLRVGFGQGWSKDEYDATGASPRGLGRRADEFLQVLKAVWTTDPVEFGGRYFRVPKAIIAPKPIQKPHPPIYLAAYAPSALKRAATLANGWNPVGIPFDGLGQMMTNLRGMAEAAGRDPAAVEVVLRANLSITPQSLGQGRSVFSGAWEEIRQDIDSARALGVHELIVDPTFSAGVRSGAEFLAIMERVRQIL